LVLLKPVCILGTGFLGTVTAVGLAELGCTVIGVDTDEDRVAALLRGNASYRETHVDALLNKHIARGAIRFTTDLAGAVREAGLVLVSIGTSPDEDGGSELHEFWVAIRALAGIDMSWCEAVVVRSPVPAGTCDEVATVLDGRVPVVYAPEFLRAGTAVADFLTPDRIIAGSADIHAAAAYAALFEPLGVPVMLTSCRNAELIKAASNAYLAMKSTFANEVANLCETVGADVDDVLRGIGYDHRIGGAMLVPGIGFGDPRLEHDLENLCWIAERNATPFRLAEATLQANREQRQRIVEIVVSEIGRLDGSRIGVWGLVSGPGTNDLRGSLAIRIIDDLTQLGAVVTVFDPAASDARLPAGATLAANALDALAGADALLVLTAWPEFARIAPNAIAGALGGGVVIDGRNLLDPERISSAGLRYRGLGRQVEAERYALPMAI
jgi:UDPglucose 6-dehydrogenase